MKEIKSAAALSGGKKVAFTGLLLLMTFALLALIEGALRLASAGYSTEPFMHPKGCPEIFVDNPDFLWKYTSQRKNIDRASKNLFRTVKQPGLLRGFVLGESTAEGLPYKSNQSFGKITEMALKSAGLTNLEILNLGYSAMSSYYVADAAKKILKYQPDFLIIYCGHNEYYGTISSTTGGGPLFKSIYLALKELKMFQVFYEWISAGKDSRQTLMAKQYDQKKIFFDPKHDQAVAGQYINNIRSVVREYTGRKIPVFIIEPVCNLVDMPPFAGERDSELKQQITGFVAALSNRQKSLELYSFYSNGITASNANLLYCKAAVKKNYRWENSLDDFIAAKDHDTIPFRARSVLVRRLAEYSASQANNPWYHFIPLAGKLYSIAGVDGFGGAFFIDHLHFNFTGQRLVAECLSQSIGKAFSTGKDNLAQAGRFCADENTVRRSVYLIDFSEIMPYRNTALLISDSPFREMLIPFTLPDLKKQLPSNEFIKNNTYQTEILSHPDYTESRLGSLYLNQIQQRRDTNRYYSVLKMLNFVWPGSFSTYLNLGMFLAGFPNPPESPIPYVEQAERLSGGDSKIQELLQYLRGRNRP